MAFMGTNVVDNGIVAGFAGGASLWCEMLDIGVIFSRSRSILLLFVLICSLVFF